MKSSKLIIAGLVLAFLAGCGQSQLPSAPRPLKNQQLQQRYPMPGGAMPGQMGPMGPTGQMGPAGGAQMGPATAEGAQALNRMRQLLATIQGFEATVTSYTQGNYKSGQKVAELRKSTTKAKLTWLKPEKLRAEVITATNPLLEGGKLATVDGQSVRARAAGLLSLFPMTLQANDTKLANNRNHSFTENNPQSLLTRLTGPSASWTVVGAGQGGAIKAFRIDNVQRLDNEITHEILVIDMRQMTLKGLEMFAGQTKVLNHDFLNFKWNPRVTSDTFTL